jgi:uncharacterized membrane protein
MDELTGTIRFVESLGANFLFPMVAFWVLWRAFSTDLRKIIKRQQRMMIYMYVIAKKLSVDLPREQEIDVNGGMED